MEKFMPSKFVEGQCYSMLHGKVVVRVEKITGTRKSAYVNLHHIDKNEAFLDLKRIKTDVDGNEFIVFHENYRPYDLIYLFADRTTTEEKFAEYLRKNIGQPHPVK